MLTAAQYRTLEFIQGYIAEHAYAPTTQEIADGINIKSRGVVYRYLKALATSGRIKLLPNRRRNIELIEPQAANEEWSIPLMGRIAAGEPIEAVPEYDRINLAGMLLGINRFALKVKGDSMIEEGIFDDDIVICEHSSTARDGQIVVALIDNNEATLKRLYKQKGDTVLLVPANSRHKPMEFDGSRVKIQGIFVGLLRYSR